MIQPLNPVLEVIRDTQTGAPSQQVQGEEGKEEGRRVPVHGAEGCSAVTLFLEMSSLGVRLIMCFNGKRLVSQLTLFRGHVCLAVLGHRTN